MAQHCERRRKLSLPWPARQRQLLRDGKDNECFHILPWKLTKRPLYQLRACFSLEWPLSNLTFQLFFSFSSWFCHPGVSGRPSEPHRIDKEWVMVLQAEIQRPATLPPSCTISPSCYLYLLAWLSIEKKTHFFLHNTICCNFCISDLIIFDMLCLTQDLGFWDDSEMQYSLLFV